MVFLIQNTQNRDTAAMQVKLDELIRAIDGAHNVLLNLEELDDGELEKIRANYLELANEALKDLREGKKDTETPEVQAEDPE
jgi:low affinity Fe/Cu permease